MNSSDSPAPQAEATSSPDVPLAVPEKPTHSESDIGTSPPPAGAFAASATAVKVGGMMAGYRLLKKLGEGGMGMVLEAEDMRLNRRVAIKVMKPEIAAKGIHRERFLREAQAAARVEHDHIVPIFQVGEENGVPFIAMPFLKGEPLDVRLKRARLDLPEIISIGRQTAEGLAAAHEQGLIHRDIKPANIWLEETEAGGVRVKILDFGLARLSGDQANLTQSGAVMGTPAYMAPEQARGRAVDHRADLFSLGCILYELSTGKRPFTGPNTMAVLSSLALDVPPEPITLNPQLPPELSRLIAKLLLKDPAKRISSANDVVETLKKLLPGNKVVVIAQPQAAPQASPWAGIDASSTEIEAAPPSEPEPTISPSVGLGHERGENVERDDLRKSERKAKKPAANSKKPWLIAGGSVGVLLAAVVALILFIAKNNETVKPPVADSPSPPSPRPPTDNKPPPTRWSPVAVDLLPLIDPGQDGVAGEWTFNEAGELTSNLVKNARLRIPYRPPAEYDLRVSFTRGAGASGMALILIGGGRQFRCQLGGYGNKFSHFDTIRGQEGNRNPATVKKDAWLVTGRRHESLVEVRKNRVKMFLDGAFVTEWKTDFTDMGLPMGWSIADEAVLGLGSAASSMSYHRVEIVEVSGPGTFVRPDDPAAQAAATRKKSVAPVAASRREGVNLLPLLDLKKDIVIGRWTAGADGLTAEKGGRAIAEFAYRPPSEYDFRIEFTCRADNGQVNQFLARGDRSFSYLMMPRVFALQVIDGRSASQNPNAVNRVLSANERHVCTVHVRDGGVAVDLDGQELERWKTDYSDMSLDNINAKGWTRRDRSLLALGATDTETIFHKAEVVELSGLGVFTRPDDLAAKQAKAERDEYVNSLGMKFVRIPKGKSWLGGGNGKPGDKEVEIKEEFYLGTYEVTQEEWENVMEKNPSSFARNGAKKDVVTNIPDADLKRFPVESVSWDDCQEFVTRLNEKLKEKDWIYRLPTEVEWEYAGRGGPMTDRADSAFTYYFEQPTNQLLPEQANFNHEKSVKRTCKVGSFPPNRLGLFDMFGNVSEWCDDAIVDGNQPVRRVTRGGCWNDVTGNFRAANGWVGAPSNRLANDGLRLARVRRDAVAPPQAGPWQPLLDDKDLSGWKQNSPMDTGKADVVVDAGQPILRLTPNLGLRTSESFGNYHLRFEYKAEKGAGGGVHFFSEPFAVFQLRLSALNETPATLPVLYSSMTCEEAELRDGRLVGSGKLLNKEKTLNTAIQLPHSRCAFDASTPWQRVEVIRLDDSFLFLVNGKIAGAATKVRDVRQGMEKLLGRSAFMFWTGGSSGNGPAQFRNIEVREISAWPPEVLTLAPASKY